MLDVKLMRRVDDVLGNAVCSMLAVGKRLSRPFARRNVTYRKICVMKFFGMGSIVVATPSLLALRDQFPDAEIHFVTFQQNRELLDILKLTDHNHFVDNSSPAAFVKSTLRVARALRKAGIDLVIDLEFYAKFPLVLASLGNIPAKAGFYLNPEAWRRELLDVSGWYNHYFHTKDIFLSLVYLLARDDCYYLDFGSFSAKYAYPRIVPRDTDLASVHAKLAAHGVSARTSRIFVINANTSPDLAPEARKWPKDRYADLARRLLADHPDAYVAFIGTKGERPYVESVLAETASTRAFSLAGELDLRELIAFFSIADLFVSNDSGPMHLACLVDTPVVGLFFADTPTLFAPIGTKAASVAPSLYSMPLFTVYHGKDVVVGRAGEIPRNVAACTVSVDMVMQQARALIGPPRPVGGADLRQPTDVT